mgnify:CR=1 FL=1
MRNLKIFLLIFFVYTNSVLMAAFTHEPTGWAYDQMAEQCFYFFVNMKIISLDGTQIIGVGAGNSISDSGSECSSTNECDAVGSFVIRDKQIEVVIEEDEDTGLMVVTGWNLTDKPFEFYQCRDDLGGTPLGESWSDDGVWYTESCEFCLGVVYFEEEIGNATTVLAVGADITSSDEKHVYYASQGDEVRLKFYDASKNTYFDLSVDSSSVGHVVNETSEPPPLLYEYGLDHWQSNDTFIYNADSLSFNISTCTDLNGVDTDSDNILDGCDICPNHDDSLDNDEDGIADGCDVCPNDANNDSDGDSYCGDVDDCPYDAENDIDNDGVCGDVDACPGYDDNLDIDGDGIADGCDICPNDPNNDADGDDVCDDQENSIEDINTPYIFEIISVYPNPFNPSITISYTLPSIGHTNIRVLDMDGREVEILSNKIENIGYHQLIWEPNTNLSSGNYFINIQSLNDVIIKKVTYIK